jgi:hypothetical protein
VFLQLSWVGLFEVKGAYHHLKKPKVKDVFLQKLTQFSQGNNVLEFKPSNIDGFYQRYLCLFNSAKQAYLEQRDPISTLKYWSWRKYSFQKVSQFSQVNNLLHAPASTTHGFLSGDIWASSPYLKGCIGKLEPLSDFKILICRKYSFPKINSIFTGNIVLDVAASNIDDYPWMDTGVTSTLLNKLFWSKQTQLPIWNNKAAGRIPLNN